MLLPAFIFSLFNLGSDYQHGWGIPMATDTAFAIGVLAMLGSYIPRSAFTFLTALAILDDLGAILVIALFYSSDIQVPYLGASVFFLFLLVISNITGIRRPVVYFILGLLLWLAMLGSGVHGTVAGILVAITVPARPKRDPFWFIGRTTRLIDRFEDIEQQKNKPVPVLADEEQHEIVENVQSAAEKASTPLKRWERALKHPVALFVLPIFAITNAGIHIDIKLQTLMSFNDLALGIVLALVLGKGLGIPLCTWLALRSRLGSLPKGLEMKHVVGLGLLGGMGFTMSIFISGLGFTDMPRELLIAKSSILTASLIAGIGGYLWLRLTSDNSCDISKG
jgi:NhaA family Na+:H+ antiporter